MISFCYSLGGGECSSVLMLAFFMDQTWLTLAVRALPRSVELQGKRIPSAFTILLSAAARRFEQQHAVNKEVKHQV